jgi:HEAT repeat protein
LNSLVPFADDVLDAVIDSTKDPAMAVRELAVQILPIARQPKNRTRVVAPLLAALTDPESNVRRHAAFALRRLQPPAEEVLPAIKEIAQHKDAGVRLDVIAYLYSGGFGNRAVPFLAQALKDPDDKVQKLAVRILEEMKADPALLFDQVLPLLEEKDNEAARINAINVIWRAGPAAVPPLLKALKDPQPKVRQIAIWSLHQGGLESASVFEPLLPALSDANAGVRASAMAALARHGSQAVPYLADGLKDTQPEVRTQAATSLGFVQAKPADVLPLLDKALHDENEEVRVAAAAALEQLGPPAAPLLLQAFRDKSDKVWKQALRSLIKMPADNRVLLPILVQATRHEDPHVRAGAAYALERFQADAVEPLVHLLKTDKDQSVHWAVVDVIDTIGMPARAAFADLIEPALKHPAEKVRYGALVAMLKMQALEKYREALTLEKYQERIGIVIPHLIRALEDRRDGRWRWQAAVILGVIGPPARDAIPALTRARDDSEPRVRDAAREALTRIGDSAP